MVGRKRGRGGGREVGVMAAIKERGSHCTWEDRTDERRKGGMDGMEGDGARE